MPISIDDLQRLLSQGPTEDAAKALKQWRSELGFSQAEAAIRLGLSLRTLQGWERGRPMPYPELLHKALDARAADKYGLVQADFPREFAEFVDFLGPNEFLKALEKVAQKLGSLSPAARTLFGDRYYFHEQCIRFSEDTPAFRLNIEDFGAVRAASLLAGINRVKRSLLADKVHRLRAMMLDNLKADRDVRQIEQEIRCATHFSRKGFRVTFADIQGDGNFDLLVRSSAAELEVECKTVTEDTGKQIKTELVVALTEAFRKISSKRQIAGGSGLFSLKLKKPASECKNLTQKVGEILESKFAQTTETDDFILQFAARSDWQQLFEAGRMSDVHQQFRNSATFGTDARCVVTLKNSVAALVLQPHKPTTLIERIVDVIKEAGDQCSGTRAAVVWLHFIGLAQDEFLSLAQASSDGRGLGLNAIVAQAIHRGVTSTDRSHVVRVRFSATPSSLRQYTTLDPSLLMRPAVSTDGAAYDVPIPGARFQSTDDI